MHDLSGRGLVQFLKYNSLGKDKSCLVIPVGTPLVATLRPVSTNPEQIYSEDVDKLTSWRNMHVKSFLTEFNATNDRTTSWLVDAVGPDDGKILFMVDLLNGDTIGHVGLGFAGWNKGYIEADAIVRGEDAPHGLMKASLKALLHWAATQLQLDDQWVRVRSDNPAVGFYQNVGFVEQKRVPLNVEHEEGFINWYEDPGLEKAQASLVYMKI